MRYLKEIRSFRRACRIVASYANIQVEQIVGKVEIGIRLKKCNYVIQIFRFNQSEILEHKSLLGIFLTKFLIINIAEGTKR